MGDQCRSAFVQMAPDQVLGNDVSQRVRIVFQELELGIMPVFSQAKYQWRPSMIVSSQMLMRFVSPFSAMFCARLSTSF